VGNVRARERRQPRARGSIAGAVKTSPIRESLFAERKHHQHVAAGRRLHFWVQL
jgi:hypothetical protein